MVLKFQLTLLHLSNFQPTSISPLSLDCVRLISTVKFLSIRGKEHWVFVTINVCPSSELYTTIYHAFLINVAILFAIFSKMWSFMHKKLDDMNHQRLNVRQLIPTMLNAFIIRIFWVLSGILNRMGSGFWF